MEGGWREAFATTLFGVVDTQEKSRVHSVCMQGSGGVQDLRAEMRAELHCSGPRSRELKDFLGILRILSQPARPAEG